MIRVLERANMMMIVIIALIRTLNISEKTQTFTIVSVDSKFQTWTLSTIPFGPLR